MCVLRGGGARSGAVLLRSGPGAGAPPGVDARCRPGCEFEGALSRRTRVVGTVRGSLTS
ncbi:hypothetical protein HMPREF1550_01823 [Actinomyces sp. oral taxon 877 str. F0543]|nr:hypothetical protein HMPREF1550_01823 [Actinomyces sp. oral taxon 877 str. F0543]